jgi:formylglycine-generating enzyme
VGELDHPINPKRKVTLRAYRIATSEVTNESFAAFVNETAYVTDAEKHKNALVFKPPMDDFEWLNDSTANWRFPNGVELGGISTKKEHPVTCISYTDIVAYCKWAKVRLPTLDEWEVASRAGAETRYWWGDDFAGMEKYGNIWPGTNHHAFDDDDLYPYTSPVASFEANPWGLYDMYGNVFEFCEGKPAVLKDVENVACARGGSWWCSRHSCSYFNSADIGKVNVHASFSNQGFRIAEEIVE